MWFGRYTPGYVVDRGRTLLYQRRHPEAPWLTPQAIGILSTALRACDRGLEWGSGRSTSWLAARTASLVSIESSPEWYERVRARLLQLGLTNVDYRYIPTHSAHGDEDHMGSPAYVERAVAGLGPDSLDYVLVDGAHRAECAWRAVDLIRPGGLLILDNAERYLPFPSRSPERLRHPPNACWRRFQERIAAWRLIWTSSGVTDTALWLRAR